MAESLAEVRVAAYLVTLTEAFFRKLSAVQSEEEGREEDGGS